MIGGRFLRTVSYLSHVKEPGTFPLFLEIKGHLLYRDTLDIEESLETGLTVPEMI